MRVRQALAVALAALLAVPAPAMAAEGGGTLSGNVRSVAGLPLANLTLELVDLATGLPHMVRTDGAGGLQAALAAGSYSVETRGYRIERGPRVLTLTAGERTLVELILASENPATPAAGSGAAGSTGGSGRSTANVVALALFSGALVGVAVRAATVRPENPSPSR